LATRFASLQLPQPMNLQGLLVLIAILSRKINIQSKHNSASTPHQVSHDVFLSLAPSFYDETHTTFAVFARVPT